MCVLLPYIISLKGSSRLINAGEWVAFTLKIHSLLFVVKPTGYFQGDSEGNVQINIVEKIVKGDFVGCLGKER